VAGLAADSLVARLATGRPASPKLRLAFDRAYGAKEDEPKNPYKFRPNHPKLGCSWNLILFIVTFGTVKDIIPPGSIQSNPLFIVSSGLIELARTFIT